jgi:hypothetical protein
MLPRAVQRTVLIFGAILAALLFFLGGAALRLLMGPISLGPFASVIEDALNHSVSGVVIRFDQAVLEWSRAEGKVNLIVLGTKVFDLDGHIVAQAPKADLDFDAAALVAGDLKLKRFGLFARLGPDTFYPTLGGAVKAYLTSHPVQWVDWEDASR